MRKIFVNILYGLAVAVLTLIVTTQFESLIVGRPWHWVLAIVVFLVCVIALTRMPAETLSKGSERVKDAAKRFLSRFRESSDGSILSRVFDFHGEPIQIIYTCRSRIDGASCPMHCESDEPTLQHVIYQHAPVDEFPTQQMVLHWYEDQVLTKDRDKLIEQFKCTYPLDTFEDPFTDPQPWSRAGLPEFLLGNLVIIGENSAANLMLDRLKPILNFYPRFSRFEILGKQPPLPKIRIDLMFEPNSGNIIKEGEANQLRTEFEEPNPTAVAMICYAPNPLSVQNRILVLFGCHRVGQYMLEQWLRSAECKSVLRRLLDSRNTSRLGQIVLHSAFERKSPEHYVFSDIRATPNAARNGLPFFPFNVPSRRVKDVGFRADARAVEPKPMVDISLIAELSKNDGQLVTEIDGFFREKLPFLRNHYWETELKDVGLHVTLFEFATYESRHTTVKDGERFVKLQNALAMELTKIAELELPLAGCEVFPTSIVLYADLPSRFLVRVRDICREAAPENDFYNKRHVPFPVHCTVIRFTGGFSSEDQKQLIKFADAYRQYSFGGLKLHTLSLLLTQKQPYQEVGRRSDFEMRPRSGSKT